MHLRERHRAGLCDRIRLFQRQGECGFLEAVHETVKRQCRCDSKRQGQCPEIFDKRHAFEPCVDRAVQLLRTAGCSIGSERSFRRHGAGRDSQRSICRGAQEQRAPARPEYRGGKVTVLNGTGFNHHNQKGEGEMKRAAVMCLMMAFYAGSVFSQTTVNLCGFVTDGAGKAIANAVVRLGQATYDNGYYAQAPYLVSTDATGYYKMGTGNCLSNTIIPATVMRADAFAKPAYVGGKVLFSLPQSSGLVRMSLYDMGGRFVRDVFNRNLGTGNYSV